MRRPARRSPYVIARFAGIPIASECRKRISMRILKSASVRPVIGVLLICISIGGWLLWTFKSRPSEIFVGGPTGITNPPVFSVRMHSFRPAICFVVNPPAQYFGTGCPPPELRIQPYSIWNWRYWLPVGISKQYTYFIASLHMAIPGLCGTLLLLRLVRRSGYDQCVRRCSKCNYCLDYLESERCPECGDRVFK